MRDSLLGPSLGQSLSFISCGSLDGNSFQSLAPTWGQYKPVIWRRNPSQTISGLLSCHIPFSLLCISFRGAVRTSLCTADGSGPAAQSSSRAGGCEVSPRLCGRGARRHRHRCARGCRRPGFGCRGTARADSHAAATAGVEVGAVSSLAPTWPCILKG